MDIVREVPVAKKVYTSKKIFQSTNPDQEVPVLGENNQVVIDLDTTKCMDTIFEWQAGEKNIGANQ